MNFCLICCREVSGEASFDSPYRACGSGGLANSLGGANACHVCCEHLPEQRADSSLSFTSVVFYKSTALLYGRCHRGSGTPENLAPPSQIP